MATEVDETAIILERLKVLFANPELVSSKLHFYFASEGAERRGQCDRASLGGAIRVLCQAHSDLLLGIPSALIDETRWRILLKRAGIYSARDLITLDQLKEIQAQTLGTLRDCFAPKELLRSMSRVPRHQARLKDHYDSFEFRAKIALGKFYHCRNVESGNLVECRQIRKDKASAPIDFIRTSLTRLEVLEHPNLPQVLANYEDFHNFFIISEPSLGLEVLDFVQNAFVRGSGLSEATVSDIVKQVLDAMAHCNSQLLGPVMHRDLHPELVLVEEISPTSADEVTNGHCRPRPRLKVSVLAFGLQPLFDLHGVGGSLSSSCLPAGPADVSGLEPESMPSSGMPEYLAPEVWRPGRDYGPKADVWACGCWLFMLLTGRPPFSGRRSLKDLVVGIMDEEPDWHLFRHASTAGLSLCRRMLDKDDTSRPTAMECLRHPWFAHFSLSASESLPLDIPLLPETFGALVQSHAHAKFYQVLMNVVATEIKVGRLQYVRDAFQNIDPDGSGYVTPEGLQAALKKLDVSAQTIEQSLRALTVGGSNQIPYTLFVAGCVDLIDDKLDHLLWKVFSMVDEDHSGEIGKVVLEHFLVATFGDEDEVSTAVARNGPIAGGGRSGAGDVERYLRSVLGPDLVVSEAMRRIAPNRDVATFEEVKEFILNSAKDLSEAASQLEEISNSSMEEDEEQVLLSAASPKDRTPVSGRCVDKASNRLATVPEDPASQKAVDG